MSTIVIFFGGLGNQLFQYAYWCQLKQEGYSLLFLDDCRGHNGFEITRYFDVGMHSCSKALVFFFRILKNMYLHNMMMKFVYMFVSDRKHFNIDRLFQYSDWQDAIYIPNGFHLHFISLDIGHRNEMILDEINKCSSVSIHIRRGDFLDVPEFQGICTLEYYNTAVEMIRRYVQDPVFFIFSDDVEWCREHIILESARYIDWNVGHGSIFDFFLLSMCSYSITANSTFSFWGALTGRTKEVVVYPRVWNSITGRVPNFYGAFDHTTKLIPLDFSKKV